MYTPKHFRENDVAKLRDFVRANGFGSLITCEGAQVRVSHLPFVLEVDGQGRTLLYAHVARANDHWKQAAQDALAVFLGPDHYVSPSWYREADTVPTWSYVAVHARGRLEWLDDLDTAKRVVERMIERYERDFENPWRADFSAKYVQAELRRIVPLRLTVASLEGKWKLNQHHPLERRVRAAEALARLDSADAREIAALMRTTIEADRPRE